MKKLHLLTQKFTLIFVLALCSVQLSAQDIITLVWQVDISSNRGFSILATSGESFIIDWGDGKIETGKGKGSLEQIWHYYITGGEYEVMLSSITSSCSFSSFEVEGQKVSKLNVSKCPSINSIRCSNNNITNIDLSECTVLTSLSCDANSLTYLDLSYCTALTSLRCNDNNLTYLDLSECTALTYLRCNDNKLTHLDLSHCPVFTYLNCNNNHLQLSDLYEAQLFINESLLISALGTQNLPSTWANIETELFADQAVFEGVFTEYKIEIDGELAPKDNYSVKDGKLVFHTFGKYTVTMTNEAIISHPDYPVEVIVKIDVSNVGVKENESLHIEVYPSPTKGELRITSYELQVTSIEVFDIFGKKLTPHTSYLAPQTSLDMSDLASGVYFVKIYTELGIITKKIVKN